MITLQETATKLLVIGPEECLDQLSDDFMFRPNGYYFVSSYERYRITDGKEGWDGYNRPLKRLGKTQAVILRGRRDELINLCEVHGYELDTRKLLPKPFTALTLADIPDDIINAPFRLDEFQRRCVLSWLMMGIGMNQMTVSGGKTACFGAAAAIIKNKFETARILYLTPAERLVKQVVAELRKFLPQLEIGQYGGGKKELDAKDIVVCTVAMLNRNFDALAEAKWFRTFNALFYDEVHHCASASSQKICLAVPAYFRFGASDSMKEDDEGRHATMRGLFGQILNEVKAAPLIKEGRIAVPHIYVEDLRPHRNKFESISHVSTPHTPAWCLIEGQWVKGEYLGPVYQEDEDGERKLRKRKVVELVDGEVVKSEIEEFVIEGGRHRILIDGEEQQVDSRWCLLQRMYDEGIIRFKERNNLIVKWAKYFSETRNLPTLIVCTRTLHIYILEATLGEVLDKDKIRICFGWASPSERDEAFEWFKTTPGAVLITPLVKEGVSINQIKAGVVADYIGSWEVANQVVGRFIRKKLEGVENFAEIVWFREAQHPIMRRGSNRVLAHLAQTEGYAIYDPAPNIDQPLLSLGSKENAT